MNARTDQLQEHYDFNIFAVGQEVGSNWVVSKTEIAFLLPAMLMETVRIQTRLIWATQRKLVNATFDERIAQLRQTQRQKRRETAAMAV